MAKDKKKDKMLSYMDGDIPNPRNDTTLLPPRSNSTSKEASPGEPGFRPPRNPQHVLRKELLTKHKITMGSGTSSTSWGGLSPNAKLKTKNLSKEFGGITVWSGHRTVEEGNKAMLGSRGKLSKYKSKWKKLLTPAQLKAGAGSEDRRTGIEAMRKGGFTSIHEDPKSGRGSRAVDFSYKDMPKSWVKNIAPSGAKAIWKETQDATDLRARLKITNPGAKITLEPGHVHMALAKLKKKIK